MQQQLCSWLCQVSAATALTPQLATRQQHVPLPCLSFAAAAGTHSKTQGRPYPELFAVTSMNFVSMQHHGTASLAFTSEPSHSCMAAAASHLESQGRTCPGFFYDQEFDFCEHAFSCTTSLPFTSGPSQSCLAAAATHLATQGRPCPESGAPAQRLAATAHLG